MGLTSFCVAHESNIALERSDLIISAYIIPAAPAFEIGRPADERNDDDDDDDGRASIKESIGEQSNHLLLLVSVQRVILIGSFDGSLKLFSLTSDAGWDAPPFYDAFSSFFCVRKSGAGAKEASVREWKAHFLGG